MDDDHFFLLSNKQPFRPKSARNYVGVNSRKARGKQYDLAGVLMVLVWAKVAGMSSMLALSQWAKDQEKIIRRSVGIDWKRMPCANTYSYVLVHIDS